MGVNRNRNFFFFSNRIETRTDKIIKVPVPGTNWCLSRSFGLRVRAIIESSVQQRTQDFSREILELHENPIYTIKIIKINLQNFPLQKYSRGEGVWTRGPSPWLRHCNTLLRTDDVGGDGRSAFCWYGVDTTNRDQWRLSLLKCVV